MHGLGNSRTTTRQAMGPNGIIKRVFAVLDRKLVWRFGDGEFDNEYDYTLVSVADTPQPCGDNQVCRQAMVHVDVDGICQFLAAQETTRYHDVFRGCMQRRLVWNDDNTYVVEQCAAA